MSPTVTVKVVAFPRHLLGSGPIVLKFVVFQIEGGFEIVMGFTSQHRSLALLRQLNFDLTAVEAFYRVQKTREPEYPTGLRTDCVGGGWVHVHVEKRRHIPERDLIAGWKSQSLGVETAPDLYPVVTPFILAAVEKAIELDDRLNPPLPQSTDGYF